MSEDHGYNPMRWDCDRSGCFNIYRRPKIEVFHDCFPGRISFGDVDGIVEINGRGLMLEWKSQSIDIPQGQRIMYTRLTRGKLLTVLVLCGDPQSMEINYMGWFFDGKYTEPDRYDTEGVKSHIKSWVDWAKGS